MILYDWAMFTFTPPFSWPGKSRVWGFKVGNVLHLRPVIWTYSLESGTCCSLPSTTIDITTTQQHISTKKPTWIYQLPSLWNVCVFFFLNIFQLVLNNRSMSLSVVITCINQPVQPITLLSSNGFISTNQLLSVSVVGRNLNEGLQPGDFGNWSGNSEAVYTPRKMNIPGSPSRPNFARW